MNHYIPLGKFVVGTCSICGGPVCLHASWCSTIPDVPTCASCGATKRDTYGPVIDMKPSTVTVTTKLRKNHISDC